MRKEEGIVRKMDKLGRVVIPAEIRKLLNVDVGDDLIISKRDNYVLVSKYSAQCLFCGKSEGVHMYKGIFMCEECLKKMGNCTSSSVLNNKCESERG